MVGIVMNNPLKIVAYCTSLFLDTKASYLVSWVHHAGVLLLALWPDEAAHGEPGCAVLLAPLHWVTPRQWHVVNNPVLKIKKATLKSKTSLRLAVFDPDN